MSENHLFHNLVRIQSNGYNYDWKEPFKTSESVQGVGTGFFFDNRGYILTCCHVIINSIQVWINSPKYGKQLYKGEVISIYPELDIAVLKILDFNEKIHIFDLGNSDNVEAGEEVTAVGYPLGQDKLKITKGIISGRQDSLFQTDTALNPGNSGGPLLSKEGKVIGINSSGFKSDMIENIGFSIPINLFKYIKKDMIEKNKKIYFQPSLGCIFYNGYKDIIEYYKSNSICSQGIIIQSILKGSNLENSDIKEGDIVCKIDDYDIDNYGECQVDWDIEKVPISSIVQRYKENDKIKLSYYSKKENKNDVTYCNLKPSNEIYHIRAKFPLYEKIEWDIFGSFIIMDLSLNHLNSLESYPKLIEYIEPLNRVKSQLIISCIYSGSILNRSGIINEGDILIEVNNIKVNSVIDFRKAIVKYLTKDKEHYIKLQNKQNKVVYIKLKDLLHENIFYSMNYNYPLTDIHNTVLTKSNLQLSTNNHIKSKKKTKNTNKKTKQNKV